MTKASERRDGPRIDLRLRVRFEYDSVIAEAEASDISPRGCRLESDTPIKSGTLIKMNLDTGSDNEDDSLEGEGHVTWCKERLSPTGKTKYDIGIHFLKDWLAKDRGPFASALARIFAMNSYEPARVFQRTKVFLNATTTKPIVEDCHIIDLSIGGLQLICEKKSELIITDKNAIKISFTHKEEKNDQTLNATVAWHAERQDKKHWGLQFQEASKEQESYLKKLQDGHVLPETIEVVIT